MKTGMTDWTSWQLFRVVWSFKESFHKLMFTQLYTCFLMYLVTICLGAIMKFYVTKPIRGLLNVNIRVGLSKSRYLAMMIWLYLERDWACISITSFPPNAMFLFDKLNSPTPTSIFLFIMLYEDMSGIFLESK